MIASIDASRTTSLSRVLYGLGILNIGSATAKLICKHFNDDIDAILSAPVEEFVEIPLYLA